MQFISMHQDVSDFHSSRRGFPISQDIDILLIHPEHVHVPIPTLRTPSSSSTKAKVDRRGRISSAFREGFTPYVTRQSSLLLQDVVPVLQDRGLIADTLHSGNRKWQGVVRVPESEDGKDNMTERRRRLRAIKNTEGHFRRLDLK